MERKDFFVEPGGIRGNCLYLDVRSLVRMPHGDFTSRSSRIRSCSDDAADTTAELGCSNCCVCLWVFPADRAGNEREVRNLCCRTQGGRANLPGCVCLASTEQATWFSVYGHSQHPFCSRTKSGRILYSSGARQTKRDERPK